MKLFRHITGKSFSRYLFSNGFALLLLLQPSFPGGKYPDDTLAVVGETIINANTFLEKYKSKLRETGLTDNMEIRGKFLQNLIEDEILILTAKNLGLDKTAATNTEYSRIYSQELLNAFVREHITQNVIVTEEDLKIVYKQLNTKIKVSHLFVKDIREANMFYKRLRNGESFEELAKECFDDPQLKNNGGSLGYITLDETEPEFEKVVFSMKPGEISEPVKTVFGYSIIKVEDVKTNPLLTENEYIKSRDRLYSFVKKRKFESALKTYSHFLSASLNIQFNNEIIEQLLKFIKEDFAHSGEELYSGYKDEDLKKTIVTYSNEKWTLGTLLEEMKLVSEKQLRWINTPENLEDMIRGLINRKVIIETALSEKLQENETFVENVSFEFETYLLSEIEKNLKSNLSIHVDSIRNYYQTHIGNYMTEPEKRLSIILLDNQPTRDSVFRELQMGVDFAQLAEKYSIQTMTAKNGGDAGFFKKNDLDYLSGQIFNLQISEWGGPYEDDGKYVFIKCTDEKYPEVTPFEVVKNEIEELLLSFEWYEKRSEIISEYQKQFSTEIFTEKLKELKL